MSLLLLFANQPGNKNLTATQAQVATLALFKTTAYYLALSPAQAQVATLTIFKNTVFFKTLTAAQGQIATLTIYKPTTTLKTLSPAQSQVAALALSKTVFAQYAPAITIAGASQTARVRVDTLMIQDVLNEQPNVASFTCTGITPTVGQDVQIGLGSTSSRDLIFGGTITTVEQIYEGKQANVAYHVTCQDYTYLLNRRYPVKAYTTLALGLIVLDMMASFSSGFTTVGLQGGSFFNTQFSIAFDGSQTLGACISQLAVLAGAYWYVDASKDLHFFATESTNLPSTIDASNILTANGGRMLAEVIDISQVRTRVNVTGDSASVDIGNNNTVAIGATTIPLSKQTPFSLGTVISMSQIISYTGVSADANKATQTSGVLLSPTAPTGSAINSVGGFVSGAVSYKVSFIGAYGSDSTVDESEVSPASGTISPSAIGTNAISNIPTTAGAGNLTGNYAWAVSYYGAGFETPVAGTVGLSGVVSNTVSLTGIPTSPDSRVVGRRLYRTPGNAATLLLVATIPNNTATTFSDNVADTSLGGTPQTTTIGGQVSLFTIPTGPTGTTGRKVYRTQVGGSSYFYHSTLPNNTTVALTDNTPDASLGVAAPGDSSVRAKTGATKLRVADLSKFSEGFGWVKVGNQNVSFTSRSGSSGAGNIQGIPATGVGALLSDVTVGQQVVAMPFLKGVTGIVYAMNQGDPVALRVQRDDLAAQAALILKEGGDGIHEYAVSDSSLVTVAACNARGDAELALFKNPLTDVTYATRDTVTRSGKPITVNLGAPTNISVTLQIQTATWTQFGIPNQPPLITVKAGQTKFNLQDLLRRAALQ